MNIFPQFVSDAARSPYFKTKSARFLRAGLPVCLLILAVPTHASSFDDDVHTLQTNWGSTAAGAAYDRIKKGGPDAVTALVKGLEGADKEAKRHLFITIRECTFENKSYVAKDTDVLELSRQARQEKDRAMRYHLIEAMRNVGGKAAPKEIEYFAKTDPEERIRMMATHFIAGLPGKEIIFFRSQTKDPSRSVQLEAYSQLSELGEGDGRTFALQVLKESSDGDERAGAVWILGNIANPNDASVLNSIAESASESRQARRAAKQASKTLALRQLPAASRLAFLIQNLDDPSALIRNWAYTELLRSSDPTTNTRLRLYLAAPGHKGYKEAGDALSSR